jgi:Rho-binding antiterminator
MNDKYIAINCEFLDRIEDWCIRKELCQIIYRQGSFPRDLETEGFIKDIFTKEKAEYILLDNEEAIRLDKIVSINGYELPKNSCRIG